MISLNCSAEQFKLQCNVKMINLVRFQGKVNSEESKAIMNVDVHIEPEGKTIDISDAHSLFIASKVGPQGHLPSHITKREVEDTSDKNTIEITRREVVLGDDRFDKVKIDRVTGYIYITSRYPTQTINASGKCSKLEMKNKF